MVVRSYVGTAGSFGGPSRRGGRRIGGCSSCPRKRRRRGGAVYRVGGRRYIRVRVRARRGGRDVVGALMRANDVAERNPDIAALRDRAVAAAIRRL